MFNKSVSFILVFLFALNFNFIKSTPFNQETLINQKAYLNAYLNGNFTKTNIEEYEGKLF